MSSTPDLSAIRTILGGQPHVVVTNQVPTTQAPAETHFLGAVLVPEAYLVQVANAFATTLPDGAGVLTRALQKSADANAAVLGRALDAGDSDDGFALSPVYTEISFRGSTGAAETLQIGVVPNRFFRNVKLTTGRPVVDELDLANAFVKHVSTSLALNNEGIELG